MSYDWWGWTLIYSVLNDNTAVTRADNIKLRSNTFFGSWIIKFLAKYASGVYITDNFEDMFKQKLQILKLLKIWDFETLNGWYELWVDTTVSGLEVNWVI